MERCPSLQVECPRQKWERTKAWDSVIWVRGGKDESSAVRRQDKGVVRKARRDRSFEFYYKKDGRPLERLSVGWGWGALDEMSSISSCLSLLIASAISCGHTTMTPKYISQSRAFPQTPASQVQLLTQHLPWDV